MKTFTRTERQGVARAFKIAKANLKHAIGPRHEGRFICLVLQDSRAIGRIGYEDYIMACQIVENRLNGANTFECWLKRNGITECEVSEDTRNGSVKAMAARHAWLDSLIAEFSK